MSEKEVETIRNIDILLTEAGVSEDSLPAVLTLFNTVMDIKERSFAEMLKSLQETIKTLNTTIAELTEKVSRLEAKNNRNCSNSNKPSSWDHFSKPKPRPSSTYAGDKKKLKSGGQVGHEGTTMKTNLYPDEVKPLYPEKCLCCSRFSECLEHAVRKSSRTVVDVEIRKVQTEYSQMSICCPEDGTVLLGKYPSYVNSPVQYGPNVNAIVTVLSSDGSMGMDRIGTFMETAFNLGMSDATVNNIICRASDRARDLVERFKKSFSGVKVGHFDETGCRFNGKNGWLHLAASDSLSIFGFDRKRGVDGIKAVGIYDMMTSPSQVVMTDFFKSYLTLDGEHPKRHAFCCAHLDRELQNLIDNHGNPACARNMKKLFKDAYSTVCKLKAKGKTEAPEDVIDKFSERYDRIVSVALSKCPMPKRTGKRGRPPKGKVRALFERFRDFKDGILMFLTDFDVPFSNNKAERCARSVKTKLKVSGCFRGENGPHNYCIVKSVLETCRKQNLNQIEIFRSLFSGRDISSKFAL